MVAAEPQGMSVLPAHKAEVNLSAALIKESSCAQPGALAARSAGSPAREAGGCTQRAQTLFSAPTEEVGARQVPRRTGLRFTAVLPALQRVSRRPGCPAERRVLPGFNDAGVVHALQYVQRGFICAKEAMPAQSQQPAPSNVPRLGGSLGAAVRLCRVAGQGTLTAGRCCVWEGARLC